MSIESKRVKGSGALVAAALAGALGAASAGCSTEVDGEPASGAVVVQAVTATPDIRWSVTGAGGPVAFSPDGTLVATGSTQSIAQTLSAANGSQVRTYDIRSTANGVSFSPDGSLLAVGSAAMPGLNLRLFRVADSTQVFREQSAHQNGTTSVAFSPVDSTLFVTGGRDKTTANTKLWNTSGTIVRSFDDGARVFAVAFSPDGARVASNASGTIHVWRIADGAQLVSIANVNQFALAYSPDGQFLTTGFELFDAQTGALVRRFTGQTGGVSAVTFTRDGGAVVAGGEDTVAGVSTPVVRYFRVADGALLTTFANLGSVIGFVNGVAISPDGRLLAFGIAHDNVTALATSPF